MVLTNVAPFTREINRLPNVIRFIAKKHCYNKDIIYQTQISLLSVLCLVKILTSSDSLNIFCICTFLIHECYLEVNLDHKKIVRFLGMRFKVV